MANLDKLNKIASGKSGWLEKAKKRQENKEWLKHSQKIAVKILRTLRKNKADKIGVGSQKELAEALSVSPQQINKIVKGKENLTLETISKLEQALNISLVFAEAKSSNELSTFEQTISEVEDLMKRLETQEPENPASITLAEMRQRAEERRASMKVFGEIHFNIFKTNDSYDLFEDYSISKNFLVNEPKIDYQKSALKEVYNDEDQIHLIIGS